MDELNASRENATLIIPLIIDKIHCSTHRLNKRYIYIYIYKPWIVCYVRFAQIAAFALEFRPSRRDGCDTNQTLMVAKLRERPSASKRNAQEFDM
jgi:hypothetical protein